jgi:hypothetical protein
MHLAIFGSTDASSFAPDRAREASVVLFGRATLDLAEQPPAPDATLVVVTLFGATKILVPAGSRVLGGGLCLFGSRRVAVRPGYGPDLRVLAVSIFGGLTIAEPALERAGAEPHGRRALPF